MDETKERAKCNQTDEEWRKEQQEFCDSRYPEGEMNNYCHSVVDREEERRKKICEK